MCKAKKPEIKQPDPTPFTVQHGDVQMEGADRAANEKRRMIKGFNETVMSADRAMTQPVSDSGVSRTAGQGAGNVAASGSSSAVNFNNSSNFSADPGAVVPQTALGGNKKKTLGG